MPLMQITRGPSPAPYEVSVAREKKGYVAWEDGHADPDSIQFATHEAGVLAPAANLFRIRQIECALNSVFRKRSAPMAGVTSSGNSLPHSVRVRTEHDAQEDCIAPVYMDKIHEKGMAATMEEFAREGLIRRVPGRFRFGLFRLSDREENHIADVNGRARTERLIGDRNDGKKDRVLARKTLWQRNTTGRYRERQKVYYTRAMQDARRRLVDRAESMIALQQTDKVDEICRQAKALLGCDIPASERAVAEARYSQVNDGRLRIQDEIENIQKSLSVLKEKVKGAIGEEKTVEEKWLAAHQAWLAAREAGAGDVVQVAQQKATAKKAVIEAEQRTALARQALAQAHTDLAEKMRELAENDPEKARADVLRSYIATKLPYGQKLSEIASNATREFHDQTRYAENNVAWFDLKGHGVGEQANPDGATAHVRCEKLAGEDGAYKLIQKAPGGIGKVNMHELVVRHDPHTHNTTFQLKVIRPEDDEEQSSPKEFVVAEGGPLHAELYRHFDQSALNALYSEGKFKSFGELFGSQRAVMYMNRKVHELTSEPMVQTLRAELEAKHINTIRGTGYSPNVAHYGENFHNTVRAEFMAAAFKLMERGEVYLDGYCGFIQNLVDHYGGCIWAYQDAKTGKVYRYNPHGNDAFTVEEKTTFAEIEDHTASAGIYEQPIGTEARPEKLRQEHTDLLPELDDAGDPVLNEDGSVKERRYDLNPRYRVDNPLPPTLKVKTLLDKFGHSAMVVDGDGNVLLEESKQRNVWRPRTLKPLGIELPVLEKDEEGRVGVAAWHTHMLRDAAGKPIMVPPGMFIAEYEGLDGQTVTLGKSPVVPPHNAPEDDRQAYDAAMAKYESAMTSFATALQAGHVSQMIFECHQETPLEHERAVESKDGRLVASDQAGASKTVRDLDNQEVKRTERFVFNVSAKTPAADQPAATGALPPSAAHNPLAHLSFEVAEIERYVKVPIFIEANGERLVMRQGDLIDPEKAPTRSLNRFVEENYEKIEDLRKELEQLNVQIKQAEASGKDVTQLKKQLRDLRQDIRSQAVYKRPMSDQSRPIVYGYQKVTGNSWDDLQRRIVIASDCVHSQQGLNDPAMIADPRISFVGRSVSPNLVKSDPVGNAEDATMGAEFVTVASRRDGAYDRYIGPQKDRENMILQNAEFTLGQGVVGRFSQYHSDMVANEAGFEIDKDGLPALELDAKGQPRVEDGKYVYKLRKWSPYLPEFIEEPRVHKMFEGDRAGNPEALYSGEALSNQRALIKTLQAMPPVNDGDGRAVPVYSDIRLTPLSADVLDGVPVPIVSNQRAQELAAQRDKIEKQVLRTKPSPSEAAAVRPISVVKKSSKPKVPEDKHAKANGANGHVRKATRNGARSQVGKSNRAEHVGLELQSLDVAASSTSSVKQPAVKQQRDFRSVENGPKLTLGLATQGAVGLSTVLPAAAVPAAALSANAAASGILLGLIAAQQVINASIALDRNEQVAGELLNEGQKLLTMLDELEPLLAEQDRASGNAKARSALSRVGSKRSIERTHVPSIRQLVRRASAFAFVSKAPVSRNREAAANDTSDPSLSSVHSMTDEQKTELVRSLQEQKIDLQTVLKVREQLHTALAHLQLIKKVRNDQQFVQGQAPGYAVAGAADLANAVTMPVLGVTATAVAGVSVVGSGALAMLSFANVIKELREWRRTKRISETVMQRFEESRGVDSSLRRAFKGWLADKRFFHKANAANWASLGVVTGSATGVGLAALAGVGITGAGISATVIGAAIGVPLIVAAAFGLFCYWGARFTRSAESTRHLDREFLGSDTNRQNKAHIMLANSEAYVQNGIGKMIEALGLEKSERVKWRRWAAFVVPSIANKRIARLIETHAGETQEQQLEMMKHLFQQERDYAAFKLGELEKEQANLEGVAATIDNQARDTPVANSLRQHAEQHLVALKRARHYQARLDVLNDKLHHGVEGIQRGVRDWDHKAWDRLRFEFLEVLGVLPDTLSRRELKERAESNPEFYRLTEGESKKWFRRFRPGVLATHTPAHRVDGEGMDTESYQDELKYFKARKGGVDRLMAEAIVHTLSQKFTAERRLLMHTVFEQLLEESKHERAQQKAQGKAKQSAVSEPVSSMAERLRSALPTQQPV